jgi:small subunit ribosomal protein S20
VLLTSQKLDEARAQMQLLAKKYDRAAAKGLVHPNTAARYKSRLMRQLNKRAATPR